MKGTRYIILSLLLVVVQVLVWSVLNLTPVILVTLLPAVILFMPIRSSDISALLFAFVISLAVDFFSHGVTGMCAVSLLPVALLRRWIIRIVFGSELASRGEDLNLRRLGYPKVILALFIANLLFLVIYIWIDGAGTRTFLFNAVRLLLSSVTSTIAGLFVASILGSESRRWR